MDMYFIMNTITVDFDVFGPFVKNLIGRGMESSLIITKQMGWVELRNLKIAEEIAQPLRFTTGDLHRTTFCLAEKRNTECYFFDF